MVTITFRTAGPWGAGIGMDLSAVQIDTNFYNINLKLADLETNPVQPNQIANITVANNQMTIVMEDATTFGPFVLPIAEFRDRGAWAPATDYVYADIFTQGLGLYMVLQEHTSAGAFDPAASNGFGPIYRLLFDASGMTMTYLDAGYPAEGDPLHAFEVFSIPDVGVFMVLKDHDATDPFDPDLIVGGDPAYQKIFSPIETEVARIQFQYAGSFPADASLMWKYINDDTRDLLLPEDFAGSSGHIEVAVTASLFFPFKFGGVEIGRISFEPGELLDGDGGQYGTFTGTGATIPTNQLLRAYVPDTADATAKYLTLAIVGSYVEP